MADADPIKTLGPRKFENGTKLRMRNHEGIFEYQVSAMSARLERESYSWMYTLNDWENRPIAGEIAESMLCKSFSSSPPKPFEVKYESEDEELNSDLQDLESKVMDEGPYEASSTYTKVNVILLCWEHSRNDLIFKTEIDDLKATFEGRFRFHAEIRYLTSNVEPRIQVRLNRVITDFIGEHDGPNTLLIVYYAGYMGARGGEYGDQNLFGFVTARHRFP